MGRKNVRQPNLKTSRFYLLIGMCAIGLVFFPNRTHTESRLQQSHLQTAMRNAANHLLKMQTDTGLFRYDFDFRKQRPTGKSNIVRQAGTGFAMAEYFAYSRDDKLKFPLQDLLRALSERSVPYKNGNVVSRTNKLDAAKTGATALSLLAELYYYRASGDGGFETSRQNWVNALMALYRPGVGFRKTPTQEQNSPYYDGEAWLALAVYNEIFEDPATTGLLIQVDKQMMGNYLSSPHISFFHWGVMAAAARYRTTGQTRYIEFIQGLVNNYLKTLRPKFKRNTNTCYAVEGLATAYPLLLQANSVENRSALESGIKTLHARLMKEVDKNLTLQIGLVQNQRNLEFSKRKEHLANRYFGSFVSRANRHYTRIDYTQHCLSMMIKLARQKL